MGAIVSPAERKVLAAMCLDWRMPVPAVAKRTGLKPHAVVYALRRLREKQLFRPFVMFNPHCLGLTDYCVFFNVTGAGKRLRDRVLDYCVESSQVTYVAELTGAYQYSASIMARSIFEVEQFFDGLSKRITQPSIEMSFGIRSQWTVMPLKYLDPSSRHAAPLTRTRSPSERVLDATDEKILTELGEDPDLSLARLGTSVGLSASSVRYRIEALIASGVIIGFPCVVDAARLGMSPFRVLIVAKGISEQFRTDLFDFASTHPLCTMFVRCVGAWDFELNFDLEELCQGGKVVQEIYDRFAPFIQSTSMVTELGVHKAHRFPMREGVR